MKKIITESQFKKIKEEQMLFEMVKLFDEGGSFFKNYFGGFDPATMEFSEIIKPEEPKQESATLLKKKNDK